VLNILGMLNEHVASTNVLCLTVRPIEQKLLLTTYRKSYMRNRLVPKWMTLIFV